MSLLSRSQFCSQRLLCRTLAGNNVHVLTISSPDCLEEVRGKICIVLSARWLGSLPPAEC